MLDTNVQTKLAKSCPDKNPEIPGFWDLALGGVIWGPSLDRIKPNNTEAGTRSLTIIRLVMWEGQVGCAVSIFQSWRLLYVTVTHLPIFTESLTNLRASFYLHTLILP